MGKAMKTITESKLEAEIRKGNWQIEDRAGNFAVIMDCETFKMWTVRIATWGGRDD